MRIRPAPPGARCRPGRCAGAHRTNTSASTRGRDPLVESVLLGQRADVCGGGRGAVGIPISRAEGALDAACVAVAEGAWEVPQPSDRSTARRSASSAPARSPRTQRACARLVGSSTTGSKGSNPPPRSCGRHGSRPAGRRPQIPCGGIETHRAANRRSRLRRCSPVRHQSRPPSTPTRNMCTTESARLEIGPVHVVGEQRHQGREQFVGVRIGAALKLQAALEIRGRLPCGSLGGDRQEAVPAATGPPRADRGPRSAAAMQLPGAADGRSRASLRNARRRATEDAGGGRWPPRRTSAPAQ